MRTRSLAISPDKPFPMLLAALLVACATQQALKVSLPRTGDVAVKEVSAADEQSYAMGGNEQWVAPTPFAENEAPAYPADLLAANLPPMTVRVRVVVDEHGVVSNSSAIDAPADYPQFFAAVQAVVGEWKFWPLVKVVPTQDGTRTEIYFSGYASTYDGQATALPFHQDYEFTFTQKDGKGTVTSVAPTTNR